MKCTGKNSRSQEKCLLSLSCDAFWGVKYHKFAKGKLFIPLLIKWTINIKVQLQSWALQTSSPES